MGDSALGVPSGGVESSTGSNAHMIYIPIGIFFVLCPIIVGIRSWARRRTSGKLDIDDFVIIAALVRAANPLLRWNIRYREICCYRRWVLTCMLDFLAGLWNRHDNIVSLWLWSTLEKPLALPTT